MRKLTLSLTAVVLLLFASCSNNNEEIKVTKAPETYSFSRDGSTSVSFSGQTTRIQMGEEFISALKTPTKTLAELNGMFSHSAGNNDFSDATLNASSKNIRSKTAASADFYSSNTTDAMAIKEGFDSWIDEQVNVVFPNWDVDAVSGVAGKIQEAGGGSTRYVNSKGVELNQLINKGLIGALMADQMLNNYLSPAVLDEATNVEDNDNDKIVTDENYTAMEHKWDEAFGYLYGNEADVTSPALSADSFLSKYLGRVEEDSDFAGIATIVYDAFKLGRAAIVNKDYTTRDKQAEIIKEQISQVIGVRAVYYLQQGKANLVSDKASAFHDLSEGLGFVYSLQFTRKPNSMGPYFTKEEVDTFMSILLDKNGFWDITEDALDQMSESIAGKFNFTVSEASN